MKYRKLLLIAAATLFACIETMVGQSKEEKTEFIANQVKKQVEAKKFKILVDRTVPMNGRSVNLTSAHSLEIRNDSVFSYLPYFGQAYRLSYGGGAGMIFEAPLTEFKQSYNKKGTAQITFRTRSEDDTHTFRVQIYPNASATVNVISINRQAITYYGLLDITEEKAE